MCFFYGRAHAASHSLLTAFNDVEKLTRLYPSRNYLCGRLLQCGAIDRRFLPRVLALLYTIPNVVLTGTHTLFCSCFSACFILRMHPRPASSYSAHYPSPFVARDGVRTCPSAQSYVGICSRHRPLASLSSRCARVASVCAAPAAAGCCARL